MTEPTTPAWRERALAAEAELQLAKAWGATLADWHESLERGFADMTDGCLEVEAERDRLRAVVDRYRLTVDDVEQIEHEDDDERIAAIVTLARESGEGLRMRAVVDAARQALAADAVAGWQDAEGDGLRSVLRAYDEAPGALDERTPLSPAAAAARAPQPPGQLVGALQDRVHEEVGKARPVLTKRQTKENEMTETKMIPVIVCCGERGTCVVYGYSDGEPVIGEPCRLERARMIVRWRGRDGGLLEVAAVGPGRGSVLSPAIPWTAATPRQVVAVTPEGAEALDTWT